MLTMEWVDNSNWRPELVIEEDGQEIARGVEVVDREQPTFVVCAPFGVFTIKVSPDFRSLLSMEGWTEENLEDIPELIAAATY